MSLNRARRWVGGKFPASAARKTQADRFAKAKDLTAASTDRLRVEPEKIIHNPTAGLGAVISADSTLSFKAIVNAIQNVSRIMMRRESSLLEARVGDAHTNTLTTIGDAPYVIGNVGFAGDANGIVYLCFTDAFARRAASQILGMTPAEIEMHG